MVAPSPVDTPYAHVRSLMHEGMQRRRRAVAACRAPPSTGAPMYGGLPVLNATRLRQSADNAFATPFPRTAVRTGESCHKFAISPMVVNKVHGRVSSLSNVQEIFP